MEQSPDTVDHCCVISYRSITSAQTLALEVLTIQFAQFPSVICVKVGEFAGRGLLQFAWVARPLAIEQRHFMRPPDALDDLIAEGRLLMQVSRAIYEAMAAAQVGMSDEDWGTDSDSMSMPKPTSSSISGMATTQSMSTHLLNQSSSSCQLQSAGRPVRPVPTNNSECTDSDSCSDYYSDLLPGPPPSQASDSSDRFSLSGSDSVSAKPNVVSRLTLQQNANGRFPKPFGRGPANLFRRSSLAQTTTMTRILIFQSSKTPVQIIRRTLTPTSFATPDPLRPASKKCSKV